MSSSSHGLPCPECGQVTPVSMEDLLFRNRFFCTGCGLSMSIDRDQSQHALSALGDYFQKMEELKKDQPSLG